VDYTSVWHSFAAVFAFVLGMFDYSIFYNSRHPVAAMLLFMAFQLIVTILLLNILIAVMTNAFAKVRRGPFHGSSGEVGYQVCAQRSCTPVQRRCTPVQSSFSPAQRMCAPVQLWTDHPGL
jgi:hypothetical protein